MNEEQLKNLKEVYLNIKLPEQQVMKNWEMISPHLGEQIPMKKRFTYFPYAVILAVLIFVVLSAVGIAQATGFKNAVSTIQTLTVNFAKGITNKPNLIDKKLGSPNKSSKKKIILSPSLTPAKEKAEVKGVQSGEKNENASSENRQGLQKESNGENSTGENKIRNSNTNDGDTKPNNSSEKRSNNGRGKSSSNAEH